MYISNVSENLLGLSCVLYSKGNKNATVGPATHRVKGYGGSRRGWLHAVGDCASLPQPALFWGS